MKADTYLLIADSERHADMLYISGIFAPDPFVVIGIAGQWHGFFSPLEWGRARKQSRLDRVHLDVSWHEKAAQLGWKSGLTSMAAAFLRDRGIEQATVPFDFPLAYAEQLSALGFKIKAESGMLFPERAVKSVHEIRCLQQAEQITRSAMKEAERFLSDSKIGNDGILLDPETGKRQKSGHLRARIESSLVARGAIPFQTIVACGREGADPHNIGSGWLRAGQPIIVDIFPRVQATGYWGDMTRTYVKGVPSAAVRKMYLAVRRAQDIGLGMVRSGVDGAEIHAAICAHFVSAGFPGGIKRGKQTGFFHGTGHGVGLEVHEAPRISVRGQVLEDGNVVTIEPGLYYPGIGGVRLEDLVVVRRDGCDNLTRHRRQLMVA